jgi:hypothetical protein
VRFSNFGAGTLQTDASGNVSVSSDERLKDIDGDFTHGIESLMGIEPITFHWNEESGFDTKTLYAGFSAQNILENIPEAVGEDKHGLLTLSDRPILAALVNAVKEMWQRIQENAEKIAELFDWKSEKDSQIAELEARIAALESQIAGVAGANGDSGDDGSTGTATITVLGNNPAQIELNSTYSDMGARAENPDGADLTVNTFVDGIEVGHVDIDTSIDSTYTITYTAEYEGETVSAERIVIVGDGTMLENNADDTATSTDETATSTEETVIEEEAETATSTEETTDNSATEEQATATSTEETSTDTQEEEPAEENTENTATSTDSN